MIQVDSIEWANDAWEVRSHIYEGIYQLPDYPVRITHLAYTDDVGVQSALKRLVRGLLERHMRRGAIPPHGLVMNWGRAAGVCQGARADLQEACLVIAGTNLPEVARAVSSHF